MIGFGPAPVGFFAPPRRKGTYVVTSLGKDTVEEKKKRSSRKKKEWKVVIGRLKIGVTLLKRPFYMV
jgi:hypothetical protein